MLIAVAIGKHLQEGDCFLHVSGIMSKTYGMPRMLQEETSDGELSINKSADHVTTPASAGKYVRGKTKKLTPEQMVARRRRLWVMIMKKEIPRVSTEIP